MSDEFLSEYAESIAVQRAMIGTMQDCCGAAGPAGGLLAPFGSDPNTGEQLTVGQWFDRHAMTLWLAQELHGRWSRR